MMSKKVINNKKKLVVINSSSRTNVLQVSPTTGHNSTLLTSAANKTNFSRNVILNSKIPSKHKNLKNKVNKTSKKTNALKISFVEFNSSIAQLNKTELSKCLSDSKKRRLHCRANSNDISLFKDGTPHLMNSSSKKPDKKFSSDLNVSCEMSILEKVLEHNSDGIDTSIFNDIYENDLSRYGCIEFCDQNTDDDSPYEENLTNSLTIKHVKSLKMKNQERKVKNDAYFNSREQIHGSSIDDGSFNEREANSNDNLHSKPSQENIKFSNSINRNDCADIEDNIYSPSKNTKITEPKTSLPPEKLQVKLKKEWVKINHPCLITSNNVPDLEKHYEDKVHKEKNESNMSKPAIFCSPKTHLSEVLKLAASTEFNHITVSLNLVDDRQLSVADESFIVCTQNALENVPYCLERTKENPQNALENVLNCLERTEENREEILAETNHKEFSESDELENNASNTYIDKNISNQHKSNVVKSDTFKPSITNQKTTDNCQPLDLVSKEEESDNENKINETNVGASVRDDHLSKRFHSNFDIGSDVGNSPVSFQCEYSAKSETPSSIDMQECKNHLMCSEETPIKPSNSEGKTVNFDCKQTKIFKSKKKTDLNLKLNKNSNASNKNSDNVPIDELGLGVNLTQSDDENGQIYKIQEKSKCVPLISNENHKSFSLKLNHSFNVKEFDIESPLKNSEIVESDTFKAGNINGNHRNSFESSFITVLCKDDLGKKVCKNIKSDETNNSKEIMEIKALPNSSPLLKYFDRGTGNKKLKLKLCNTKGKLKKSLNKSSCYQHEDKVCSMNSSKEKTVNLKLSEKGSKSNSNEPLEIFSCPSQDTSIPVNENGKLICLKKQPKVKKNNLPNVKSNCALLNKSINNSSCSTETQNVKHNFAEGEIMTCDSESSLNSRNTNLILCEQSSPNKCSGKHQNNKNDNSLTRNIGKIKNKSNKKRKSINSEVMEELDNSIISNFLSSSIEILKESNDTSRSEDCDSEKLFVCDQSQPNQCSEKNNKNDKNLTINTAKIENKKIKAINPEVMELENSSSSNCSSSGIEKVKESNDTDTGSRSENFDSIGGTEKTNVNKNFIEEEKLLVLEIESSSNSDDVLVENKINQIDCTSSDDFTCNLNTVTELSDKKLKGLSKRYKSSLVMKTCDFLKTSTPINKDLNNYQCESECDEINKSEDCSKYDESYAKQSTPKLSPKYKSNSSSQAENIKFSSTSDESDGKKSKPQSTLKMKSKRSSLPENISSSESDESDTKQSTPKSRKKYKFKRSSLSENTSSSESDKSDTKPSTPQPRLKYKSNQSSRSENNINSSESDKSDTKQSTPQPRLKYKSNQSSRSENNISSRESDESDTKQSTPQPRLKYKSNQSLRSENNISSSESDESDTKQSTPQPRLKYKSNQSSRSENNISSSESDESDTKQSTPQPRLKYKSNQSSRSENNISISRSESDESGTKQSTPKPRLKYKSNLSSRSENIICSYTELNISASEGLLNETVKNIQCFLSAGEAELEKLKELNINVDWELSHLHQVDTGSQKISLNLLEKKVQSKNIKVLHGSFTEKEQRTIKRNWETFSEIYEFSDPSLFMPSTQLHGNFKLKERLKFKQFLAKGLPNRRLYCVYKKFCDIYGVSTRGRWTRKEDRLLLDLYNALEETDGEWDLPRNVILNKALKRNCMSVHRRLKLLLDNEDQNLLGKRAIDWTPELSGKLIHHLLKQTKYLSLEDLRHATISYEVWHSVAVKLELPFNEVLNHWRFTLYPQLFSHQFVLRSELYRELISWFYSSGVKRWKKVDWFVLSRRAGDLGPCFLFSCFKALVSNYVPSSLHRNLRASVKFLYENYLPTLENKKESRLLKRLKYNQDSRAVEEIEMEGEIESFRIENDDESKPELE